MPEQINNVQTIKDMVNEIFKDADEITGQIKKISEIKSMNDIINNINVFGPFIMNIVYAIERVSKLVTFTISSDDKLNAAVSIIDDKIKFPWYLEVIDEYVFKIIINLTVLVINKLRGNDWNMKEDNIIKIN